MQCCVAWFLRKLNVFETFKVKNIIPLAHHKMCLPFLTGCNYENFCCLHVLIGFKSNHNHIMYIYSLQQKTMFISTNLFCFWYLQLCFKSVRAYYNGKMHDTESVLSFTINQYEMIVRLTNLKCRDAQIHLYRNLFWIAFFMSIAIYKYINVFDIKSGIATQKIVNFLLRLYDGCKRLISISGIVFKCTRFMENVSARQI